MDRCDNVIGLDIHAAFCNFEGHFLKEVGHDGTISSCWVDGVIFRDGHLHLDTKDFLSVEILPRLDVRDGQFLIFQELFCLEHLKRLEIIHIRNSPFSINLQRLLNRSLLLQFVPTKRY